MDLVLQIWGGLFYLTNKIGVMIGFLLGSYLLAKNKTYGWLFFMIVNASMGTLMIIQNKPILAFQRRYHYVLFYTAS